MKQWKNQTHNFQDIDIYCTHSPDIITASLENSVIFLGPPKDPPINQAILVKEDDETHEALKLLGHSIGIIALGKKLVLIEGEDSSLDKQVYGTILKSKFPNLVLVPSGGKEVVTSFSSAMSSVLDRTIWGVEFFMVCDRDAVPLTTPVDSLEEAGKGRLKVLPRYHLENYFLDENVLASAFSTMEPDDSWLRDPAQIRAKLREIAGTMVSYTAALTLSASYRSSVGNLDILPKECHKKTPDELAKLMQEKATSEKERISSIVDESKIEVSVKATMNKLQQSLDNDTEAWKSMIPGKQLFISSCLICLQTKPGWVRAD